jgi:formylglycine-generating enzyme required for sulfatase activity
LQQRCQAQFPLPHNGSCDGNPASVTPRVFLSYSHDSEAHRAWVRRLAERLLEGGVEVTLDQWDLPFGADVVRFMELGIRDADRVLMVCTANYVAKAEERKGGAGYEGMIITGHVARATDTIKFAPIVRDHAGESLVPGFLGQRLWLDFRDDGLFEERLEELLRELHGAPRYPKPPLGRNPFAGPELEAGAKAQESPSPTPGTSRGSRETAGHRQEAGAQQGDKGAAASAADGTPAPVSAPEGNPAPVSAPPAAPDLPNIPAADAPPVSTPAAAANLPPLALSPLTVPTASLRREGGRWLLDRQEVRVGACDVDLGDGESLRLIQIPAGDFLMGSPANEPERFADEGPQHRVRLGGFLLGQTPVTQAQWGVVARWPKLELDLQPNPSRFKGARRPVEKVSWEQAMEFCRRLSQRTGLPFTLPSEAQWEYACRAGSTTPFAFGDTITPELANYDATNRYAEGPKGHFRAETTDVASFPANAWGLHDMHGNVWEWCLDTWHGSYEGAPTDGSPWLTGNDSRKLLRGGSWSHNPRYCRSAYRNHLQPVGAYAFVGFRVVCLPQGPSLIP